eukprot:TRINITY_DN20331_c0_g1_i1.p2 TRINITY_DN20331_c0_g1~~TRINITY_DN20331_c0_g1_i1.p2  ORF type:complete len:133 (-),score=9.97 TRINITY_DN20331_c0_g1_i1:322-720(-)
MTFIAKTKCFPSLSQAMSTSRHDHRLIQQKMYFVSLPTRVVFVASHDAKQSFCMAASSTGWRSSGAAGHDDKLRSAWHLDHLTSRSYRMAIVSKFQLNLGPLAHGRAMKSKGSTASPFLAIVGKPMVYTVAF